MTSMPSSTPVATVFGGSGFIGRYVTQRLARAGWRVRVAVRRPDEAYFVRPYGVVGQVEPVQANLRDDASTRRAVRGAAAVVNCVGILAESGKQSFEAVIAEGAGRIARLAAEEGASAGSSTSPPSAPTPTAPAPTAAPRRKARPPCAPPSPPR